ncbi:MAG TPA: hypothetical protein VF988_03855 [Verrucomicrobiae bacterium]
MKPSSNASCVRRPGAATMGVAAGTAAVALWLAATGTVLADNSTNTVPATVAPEKSAPVKPIKQKHPLSGVELYAIHCNRCHPERYPVEMNSAEWQTIMLHMRVRANLPADQARAIMKYLQEEAGD